MKNGRMKLKFLWIGLGAFLLLCAIAAAVCLWYFRGIPKCVGETRYRVRTEQRHVRYDGIDLFGVALIPQGEPGEKFPTVIYAHGAESDYRADMTTLKCLAKSGIACYSFDFYGWTARSTGPDGAHWFRGVPRGVDDAYERQVLKQARDLNAVIAAVKTFDFVDGNALFLLGSSMGGATAAAASLTHTDDIRAMILQYPAINLVPGAMTSGGEYDANQFENDVLILQGSEDKIVSLDMAKALAGHYNTLRPGHCTLVVYAGQPHVFTGKYKVAAAEEIYRFLAGQTRGGG